jgi:hypothetical protein
MTGNSPCRWSLKGVCLLGTVSPNKRWSLVGLLANSAGKTRSYDIWLVRGLGSRKFYVQYMGTTVKYQINPWVRAKFPHSTMIFFKTLKCMKNDQTNDLILLLTCRDLGAWIELWRQGTFQHSRGFKEHWCNQSLALITWQTSLPCCWESIWKAGRV